jgi:hypothetical protein
MAARSIMREKPGVDGGKRWFCTEEEAKASGVSLTPAHRLISQWCDGWMSTHIPYWTARRVSPEKRFADIGSSGCLRSIETSARATANCSIGSRTLPKSTNVLLLKAN